VGERTPLGCRQRNRIHCASHPPRSEPHRAPPPNIAPARSLSGPSSSLSRPPTSAPTGRCPPTYRDGYPQEEPFPLLLERQSNAVAWHSDAEAGIAARAGEQQFQRAAMEALVEARQVGTPACWEML
jgi:hypothetical protein